MKPNEINLIDRTALHRLCDQYPDLSRLQLAQMLIGQLEECLDCLEAERCRQPSARPTPTDPAPMPHKARGRRATALFSDEETVLRVKLAIRQILRQHRKEPTDAVCIGTESYPTTDFLTAIYYALVERGEAAGVLNDVTKGYYDFLKEVCLLDGLASYRAFANRFRLVRNLGKEFHRLTKDDFRKTKRIETCMPPDKFPLWKEMVQCAMAALDDVCL